MGKKVTIKQIAQKAGVSINTVSRALNNKPDIKPSTKERIRKIAESLNYKPDRFARGLKSRFTETIGVIVTDISNPYFGALVKQIEKCASEKNYSIILCDTDEKVEREKRAVELMVQERVDGILLTPVQEDTDSVIYLSEQDRPFVLVGRHFEHLPTNYVVADDTKGGFLATKHLIDEGCKKIVHIQGPDYISSSKERLEGYKRAIEKCGLSFDPEFVNGSAITMRDGYRIAQSIISKGNLPDGIFAFSDYVALGVLRALQEEGINVPEDIAVVGYDDIAFASYLTVPLTTVRMPREKISVMSVELLYEQILSRSNVNPTGIKLDVNLIVRKSSLKSTKQ